MTWTTTAPTAAGYYWLRTAEQPVPQVVLVANEVFRPSGPPLRAWYAGYEMGDDLAEVPAAEWAGPLVPPT